MDRLEALDEYNFKQECEFDGVAGRGAHQITTGNELRTAKVQILKSPRYSLRIRLFWAVIAHQQATRDKVLDVDCGSKVNQDCFPFRIIYLTLEYAAEKGKKFWAILSDGTDQLEFKIHGRNSPFSMLVHSTTQFET
jgi:hypothetical protein